MIFGLIGFLTLGCGVQCSEDLPSRVWTGSPHCLHFVNWVTILGSDGKLMAGISPQALFWNKLISRCQRSLYRLRHQRDNDERGATKGGQEFHECARR